VQAVPKAWITLPTVHSAIVLLLCLALHTLTEAIRLPYKLQNVGSMGQPVEQCSCQPFVAEDLQDKRREAGFPPSSPFLQQPIIAVEVWRLSSHCDQLGPAVQVDGRWLGIRVHQLTQAQQHPIGMGTAILQGLSHRLSDPIGGIVTMQLQDADELPNAPSVRPLSPQAGQQMLVDRRPPLPPVANGLGVVKGTRPLLQERQT